MAMSRSVDSDGSGVSHARSFFAHALAELFDFSKKETFTLRRRRGYSLDQGAKGIGLQFRIADFAVTKECL